MSAVRLTSLATEAKLADMPDESALYVWTRTAANLLGLADWEIELDERPNDDDEALASVHVPRGRKVAQITTGKDFANMSTYDQRETMVHELVHCHFMGIDELSEGALPGLIGRSASTVYHEAQELIIEAGVDGLAVAITALLGQLPEGST